MYLISETKSSFDKNGELPSNQEVLQVFLYFLTDLKKKAHQSAFETTKLLIDTYGKESDNIHKSLIVKKITKMYETWKNLRKNMHRKDSPTQKEKESFFKKSLAVKFKMICKKRVTTKKVSSAIDRCNISNTRTVMHNRLEEKHVETLDSDTDSESDNETSPNTKQELLSPVVSSALDRCNISNTKAMHILNAVAKTLNLDSKTTVVSVSSIRRRRISNRIAAANALKINFQNMAKPRLLIHWDGKLLPDLVGREVVDRIAILVSGDNMEQLLAVPKLLQGTGSATAASIKSVLDDWNVGSDVVGFCFDTTAANTGKISGTCILLQDLLKKNLLFMACRHHINEIILEKAFEMTYGPSSGPEITIFKRFQKSWSGISQSNFRSYEISTTANEKLSVDIIQETIKFCTYHVTQKQPREDYKELLNLTIIFLGGVPPGGVRFRAPAGLHRARWMARLIYSFKLFIFGTTDANKKDGLFYLTVREETNIVEFLCFAIGSGYIISWINAPLAASAPKNDLDFLNKLKLYAKVNKNLAEAAIKKFMGHFWYLSEELIRLAFFDRSLSADQKRLMVLALNNNDYQQNKNVKRAVMDFETILKMPLCVSDFVSPGINTFDLK